MRTKKTMVVLTTSNENLYDEKFFEPIGPNDEILLEYTIYDAIEAGFERIVLVVTDSVKQSIKKRIQGKFGVRAKIYWVGINPISTFFLGRRIPYRLFSLNSYALWKVKRYINAPFLVVDGHFYHGKEVYREALNFMVSETKEFAVINSPLGITLSRYGGVDRGICITKGKTDSLKKIIEAKKIRKRDIFIEHQDENPLELSGEMLATTGVFCLNPAFFETYREYLKSSAIGIRTDNKEKITITELINFSLKKKLCHAKALTVSTNWFSINFKPERVLAIAKIRDMVNGNLYPRILQ